MKRIFVYAIAIVMSVLFTALNMYSAYESGYEDGAESQIGNKGYEVGYADGKMEGYETGFREGQAYAMRDWQYKNPLEKAAQAEQEARPDLYGK